MKIYRAGTRHGCVEYCDWRRRKPVGASRSPRGTIMASPASPVSTPTWLRWLSLNHLSHVGVETGEAGDAMIVPRGERLAPTGFLRRQSQYSTHPCRVPALYIFILREQVQAQFQRIFGSRY